MKRTTKVETPPPAPEPKLDAAAVLTALQELAASVQVIAASVQRIANHYAVKE